MTLNHDVRIADWRRVAGTAASVLLAAALVTACGGSKEEAAAVSTTAAAPKDPASVGTPPATIDEKHARLASAVVDGKTTAPVDMQYDVVTKPALGQPFEVDMTFDTRLPADTLDIEISEAPGLTVVGDKTASFAPVEAGKSYVSKLLVKGDNPGLYYIGVIAKMATKVQTETRAFAIPIVIGDAVAVQKPAPAKDASGQAIQSMPAQEPK